MKSTQLRVRGAAKLAGLALTAWVIALSLGATTWDIVVALAEFVWMITPAVAVFGGTTIVMLIIDSAIDDLRRSKDNQ